jgi:hypothetical protein
MAAILGTGVTAALAGIGIYSIFRPREREKSEEPTHQPKEPTHQPEVIVVNPVATTTVYQLPASVTSTTSLVSKNYLNESYLDTRKFAQGDDPNKGRPFSEFVNHLDRLNHKAYRIATNQQDMLQTIQRAKQRDDFWTNTERAIASYTWEGEGINPMGVVTDNDEKSSGFFFYNKDDLKGMLYAIELMPVVS